MGIPGSWMPWPVEDAATVVRVGATAKIRSPSQSLISGAPAYDSGITEQSPVSNGRALLFTSGFSQYLPAAIHQRQSINAAIRDLVSEFKTKETESGVALFSVSEGGPVPEAQWLSDGAITQVVEEKLAQFAHKPPVLVRDSITDVLRNGARDDGLATSGMVYQGRIHLFRDGLADRDAAARTLWHEMLHYGLRRFLTKEQYIAKLNQLYVADGWIRKQANAWMKSPEGMEVADRQGAAYARARGVDEALAALAEVNEGEFAQNGLVARAVRAVARWVAKLARSFGFADVAARWEGVTNDQARALVKAMFRKLRNGEVATSSDWAFTADPAFMVAWHGSPHDHDGFDSSRIGTGEGAQTYGYGHYFASKREVAEWYRNKLTGGALFVDGKKFDAYDSDHIAAAYSFLNEGDRKKAVRDLREALSTDAAEAQTRRYIVGAIRLLESESGLLPVQKAGRLYQVELAPSEDEYLLWDKPLSKQSEKVKAALNYIGKPDSYSVRLPKDTGGWVVDFDSEQSGKRAYAELSNELEGGKAASAYLHSIGIRGIKYLDGSSRGAGDGSFDYVIFDDADVSIAAKFSRADRSAIDTATRRMDRFIAEFENGTLKDSDTQVLGDTPAVLQALGATNLPLQIDGATVRKALAGKHRFDISADALRQIASHLYDPLAVFDSATGSGLVVLTEVASNSGAPVVAAIHLDKRHGGMVVNDVASIHEKTSAEASLTHWINSGLLRYVRNEKDLSGAATRHPLPASVAALMKGRMGSVVTEADVVNQYGSRYSAGTESASAHTAESLSSALSAIPGKAGNAIRALIGDGKTGLIRIHTAAEIPQRILDDASYSQAEGAQSEYEVQPETARNRTLDGAELRALRRAAARVEAAERGITFTVYPDGRAVVTGPARTKVPARFQRFANAYGLTLVVRRSGEAYANANARMPLQYREAGALYFGEIGDKWIDRTGLTRFSADRDSIRAYVDPQDGTVHVIADNIPAGWTASQLEGLVKHEVSVHVMRLGKGDAEFQQILKAADGMRQAGSRAMREAFARVPEKTNPEHVLEEGLAYFIEAHPKSAFTQRVVAWFRKMLRKVGAAFAGAERLRVFAWANALTEGDLIQMAHDALLAAPVELSGKQWSLSENEGAAALASMFDAPLEEAQRQYAAVVDRYKGTPQWMMAPNGEKTKLNERQWVQTRTPLFKAWFGDFETAGLRDFLNGKPLADLQTSEAPHKGYAALREWAVKIFNDYGNYANSPALGKVLMDERSVRDSIGHGINPFKAVAFKAVPDVIEQGRIVHSERRGSTESIYISAPVRINGADDVVTVLVHRDTETNRMYLHSVTTKENLRDGQVNPGLMPKHPGDPGLSRQGGIYKILHAALNFNGDVSKVVGANGEPLVVYHGTQKGGFSVFYPNSHFGTATQANDLLDAKAIERAKLIGRPGKSGEFHRNAIASGNSIEFGENDSVYAVFLNISNPARMGDVGHLWGRQAEAMERHGHDGIVYENLHEGPGDDSYVAFSPTQIKSAVSNRGTFDKGNPDIRYSKAPGVVGNSGRQSSSSSGWSVSEPSRLDSVIYALQDKQIDMKRVVQSIMKTAKQISDDVNAYLQEELFHGRAAKGVQDFLNDELRPLIAHMRSLNVEMSDFEEYLPAQ